MIIAVPRNNNIMMELSSLNSIFNCLVVKVDLMQERTGHIQGTRVHTHVVISTARWYNSPLWKSLLRLVGPRVFFRGQSHISRVCGTSTTTTKKFGAILTLNSRTFFLLFRDNDNNLRNAYCKKHHTRSNTNANQSVVTMAKIS